MYKILPFILVLLLISSCSSEDQPKPEPTTKAVTQVQVSPKAPFQSIQPTEAMALIGDKPDLLIVDVRTSSEIRQYGAVPNSIHKDLGTIARNGLPYPKDQPLLIICAVGGRSYAVGKFLVKRGHTEIYNLSGGLDRWSQQGLPIVFPQ